MLHLTYRAVLLCAATWQMTNRDGMEKTKTSEAFLVPLYFSRAQLRGAAEITITQNPGRWCMSMMAGPEHSNGKHLSPGA